MNQNPYQVTNEFTHHQPHMTGYGPNQFYVDGSQIRCGSEVILPPVCVRTGEREDLVEVRRKAIYYVNPLVYLGFLGGLLLLLILYLILRKKVVVTYHISRRVRNRRMLGMISGVLLFVSSFVVMPVMMEVFRSNEGIGVILFIVMMIAGLILMLISQSPITAKRYQDGSIFWLGGFKPPFFDTLRSIYRPNEGR